MKFYVYSGYISPDNCGSERVTHTLKTFNSTQEVLKYREEFQQEINDECSLVVFHILQGNELTVEPEEVVTKYRLVHK